MNHIIEQQKERAKRILIECITQEDKPVFTPEIMDDIITQTVEQTAEAVVGMVEVKLPNESNTLYGFPVVVSEKEVPTVDYSEGFTEGFNECRRQILFQLQTLKSQLLATPRVPDRPINSERE